MKSKAVLCAVLAAALYAINSPFSKILLEDIQPTMMAGLLYTGAGLGMLIIHLAGGGRGSEERLSRKELPYTIGMVLLDIAAPILMMSGLKLTNAANASLLNNFEIVATSLIALIVFREGISPRLWGAIILITLSSMLLSLEDASAFEFSLGSVLVLLACTCWGLENNCTRMISSCDPQEIVIVKGFGSGIASLCIALAVGEPLPRIASIPPALLLGFASYGMSVFLYVRAQRDLGAARTSAYYAVAPFIGAALSSLLLNEEPGPFFAAAFIIMAFGAALATMDTTRA